MGGGHSGRGTPCSPVVGPPPATPCRLASSARVAASTLQPG